MNTSVPDAYAARASEYVESLGSVASLSPVDAELIAAWGEAADGPVIDAGSGPGHWTHYLHERGVAIEGVDLVSEFVQGAAVRYPGIPFRVASIEALDVSDGALAGLLAWYSVIHTPPSGMPTVLSEFARCVRPGGSLLLGFFEGAACEPFDHAVVTAYYWPVDKLSHLIAEAGFEIEDVHTRTDVGHRPHGAIVARRR